MIKKKLETLGLIGAALVAFYAIPKFVDWRISEVISDKNFAKEVARYSRPELIIDAKGSYLYDGGALEYIDNIELVHDPKLWEGFLPAKIIITPSKHMNIPPMVSCIDGMAFPVKTQRGKNSTFTYEFDYGMWDKHNYRFRIEILDK